MLSLFELIYTPEFRPRTTPLFWVKTVATYGGYNSSENSPTFLETGPIPKSSGRIYRPIFSPRTTLFLGAKKIRSYGGYIRAYRLFKKW
jgi:hypothetical protein